MNDNTTSDERDMEPAVIPNAIIILIKAVVSLLMVSSIFINILIIVAVKKFKRLQIPANFIMVNLSVADCSVAAVSSTLLLGRVNENVCISLMGLGFLTCSASLLSLSLIAYDRFSALVKPLTYSSRLTYMRIVLYISFIWLYAALITAISLGMIMWSDDLHILPTTSPQSRIFCSFRQSVNYSLICQISFIFVPGASVMFYCYCRVMLVARHHSRAISAVQGFLRKPTDNKPYGVLRGKKYFVTLTSILGVFSGTWGLFVTLTVLNLFCQTCFNSSSSSSNSYPSHTYYFCILPLLSTGINPWIYSCRSQDFKAAFGRLYKSAKACCKGERPDSNRHMQDSRFDDGLSRTNSMIGNMQHIQALYNETYYNQKNENNDGPKNSSPPMTALSISQSVPSIKPKSAPSQGIVVETLDDS